MTLTSRYNRFGEREQLDLAQGSEILSHIWTYDAMGRLDFATLPGSATPVDFTPFSDDTLAKITRPSGATTDYTYFAQGPIESITVKAADATQLQRLAYAVDAVQNITSQSEQHATSDPTGAYVFGYDAANRLTSASYPAAYGFTGNQAYIYDPAGNREDPVDANLYAYDANNRLTASPGIPSYGFDDDGNLTARTGETFSYDFTNRLRSFSKTGTAASYAYDPFGRRIRKSVNGVTTWYLWDGDQLLAEYDGSGARTVRYAYAGSFAPVQVAYKNSSGEDVYDVHSDHLDTPRLLTDSSGAVVWREAHEAFGKAVLDPANTVTFNVRFPGQYFDAESGLHDNRFRTYDPAIGRYVSVDPIGQYAAIARDGAMPQLFVQPGNPDPELLDLSSAGPHLYAYGGSDPVGAVDPLGLFGFTDVPNLPQGAVNFSAGFGDALLLGTGSALRDATGAGSFVAPCSGAYQYGGYAALAAGLGRLAYATVAKVGAAAASSGVAAHAFRNTLKAWGRVRVAPNWRAVSYAESFAEKGSDAAVQLAAGKTNRFFNAYGALVGAVGAANGGGCGCGN